MRICQDHWDRLREKIEAAGLKSLVSDSGHEVAEKMKRELEGQDDLSTFDPLMGSHWAVVNNSLDYVSRANPHAPLYIMGDSDSPEDPVDPKMFGDEYAGRTWPRCPLCYLNLAHEVSCKGCELPQEGGFDWMLDRAVQDQVDRWKELSGS